MTTLTCLIVQDERDTPLLGPSPPREERETGAVSQKELRALIRERMRNGQLPPVLGGETFVDRGRDTACDCCGEIIARHETVYEVRFAPQGTDSRRGFIVHTQCHWIWCEESALADSPEQPGSVSQAWSALKESIERACGPSVN